MSQQVTGRIRAGLLAGVFVMAGWFVVTPGMIQAQDGGDDHDGWDECLFEGEPGIGPCNPNSEHEFEPGICEGVDCYGELETCCQMSPGPN